MLLTCYNSCCNLLFEVTTAVTYKLQQLSAVTNFCPTEAFCKQCKLFCPTEEIGVYYYNVFIANKTLVGRINFFSSINSGSQNF